MVLNFHLPLPSDIFISQDVSTVEISLKAFFRIKRMSLKVKVWPRIRFSDRTKVESSFAINLHARPSAAPVVE